MFRDVSDQIAHNPPGRYSGVAVADVDGDGRFEFVVAGFAGPNRVLKWAGGQLRDIAPPVLADPDRQAVGVTAADLDGDGAEELYVLNTDTFTGPKWFADRLFKRAPDGQWEDLFARPANRPVWNLAAGRAVAAIDRRGGGRYGFFVANCGQPARLYELGPAGLLVDLAPPLELSRAAGAWGVLAAPLFGAHTDLFCANEGGPNFLFRNRGNGTFEECAGGLQLADPDEHGRAAAAVDLDGDGRLDLCWGNWEGPHRLMVRRADRAAWRDRATPGLAFPSAVRTVIAADFDNDGHDELFFNNAGEPNRLFRILAGGGHEPVEAHTLTMLDAGDAAEPDGPGTGAAVADIDGDGVLELLVAHGESSPQPLGVYKARGTAGNGWLRVLPRTRFGAPARGAVVRAGIGGRVMVKVIDGGSGFMCQMEPVAHFGLGRATRVDRVTVTWPDGAALALPNPDLNCTYSVPYPGS
ncbi:MAG: hypothetical protein JWO38_2373 [Gemmataceae bacterium]|nr:hypothetical protein [Gemmataceae bacterium]